jgi:ATP-dependent Clp protease ATP-binding subunit ClpA
VTDADAGAVLELSLREATQLGQDHIGAEHILLGVVREGDGVAAQVLVKLGADLRSAATPRPAAPTSARSRGGSPRSITATAPGTW